MSWKGCRGLLRPLAVLTSGVLIPTVLLAFLNPSPMGLLRFFLTSMVYSFVIGGMAYSIIPSTWPYYLKLKVPWNWCFRFGLLLAISAVGTLISVTIFWMIGWMQSESFWTRYLIDLRVATFFTMVTGSIITIYETMRARLEQTTLDLRTKELERERALKLATAARLSSLESRIHPHFLFNALNSISALIQEDPKRAERLLERMAALLRFSLDAGQSGLVPLEHEMKIVTDYLEIEQARFGARLRYSVDFDPHLGQILVPPLSLQTLVENSVKYAVAPSRSGGDIRIRGDRPNGAMRVAVSDSGPGFDIDAAPPGHGIDILRGRLAALFDGAAELTQNREDGMSTVTLVVPGQ